MERPQRAAAYLHDRPFGSRHDNRRRHLGVEVAAAQAFELLCGAAYDRILPCSLPKRRFAARQSVHCETTQQERDYVQRFSHFGGGLTYYATKIVQAERKSKNAFAFLFLVTYPPLSPPFCKGGLFYLILPRRSLSKRRSRKDSASRAESQIYLGREFP